MHYDDWCIADFWFLPGGIGIFGTSGLSALFHNLLPKNQLAKNNVKIIQTPEWFASHNNLLIDRCKLVYYLFRTFESTLLQGV